MAGIRLVTAFFLRAGAAFGQSFQKGGDIGIHEWFSVIIHRWLI
jgi:hypothetical protein